MKDSEAYLQAAKLIHEHKAPVCCYALSDVKGITKYWESTPLSLSFVRDTHFDDAWMYDADPEEARQIRVLLLCLMSAKAKSEGR